MSEHAATADQVATSDGHDAHEGFAHPMPVWQLLAVFFALVALTILTVFQASFEVGKLELVLSLLIATIKASLVVLFFMHMIHDKPLNAIIFLSSFVFVALFLGFTLMDAAGYNDVIENTVKNLEPAPAASSME